MPSFLAQAEIASQVTQKELVLLVVGIAFGGLVSWYASCVVGRYLYFRQILDQARSHVINTAGVLKPASLPDRQAVVLQVSAEISGFCGQLVTHGHKDAADKIKATLNDYTANLYTALKELHSLGPKLTEEKQVEISSHFKDWLTLQNGAYMLMLAGAKPSKGVLLLGFKTEKLYSNVSVRPETS